MRFHLLFLGCTVFTQDVISQLKADFSANITNACVPVIVKFTTASSGNPTQWKWDLRDDYSCVNITSFTEFNYLFSYYMRRRYIFECLYHQLRILTFAT